MPTSLEGLSVWVKFEVNGAEIVVYEAISGWIDSTYGLSGCAGLTSPMSVSIIVKVLGVVASSSFFFVPIPFSL